MVVATIVGLMTVITSLINLLGGCGDCDRLKNEIAEANRKIGRLNVELDSLKNEQDALSRRVAEATAAHKEKIEEKNREIADLRTRNKFLMDEITRLYKAITDINRENENRMQRLTEMVQQKLAEKDIKTRQNINMMMEEFREMALRLKQDTNRQLGEMLAVIRRNKERLERMMALMSKHVPEFDPNDFPYQATSMVASDFYIPVPRAPKPVSIAAISRMAAKSFIQKHFVMQNKT